MATLADLVARWRLFLDDSVETYLWSNAELTAYANAIIDELCLEIPLIEDSTTAAICQVAVTTPTATYSIDPRIVFVQRAKLGSQTQPLPTRTVAWMDANIADWENATAADPIYLIAQGLGTNTVRLYPPPDANDTLYLTVTRKPLSDLSWSTPTAAPEIPTRLHALLDNGVYFMAYNKQDADTYSPKKAAYHERLWLQDKEKMKKAMLKFGQREEVVTMMLGFS